jgi:hypothetical protein
MGQGDLALITTDLQGLGVLQVRVSGCGVTRMPDGKMSGQAFYDIGGKDLVHVTHTPHTSQGLTVGNGNAGAFLPPVLEGVQPQVGQFGRLRMTINRENSAVVMKLIIRERIC